MLYNPPNITETFLSPKKIKLYKKTINVGMIGKKCRHTYDQGVSWGSAATETFHQKRCSQKYVLQ